MSETRQAAAGWPFVLWLGVPCIVAIACGVVLYYRSDRAALDGRLAGGLAITAEEQRKRDHRVEQFCSSCHVTPPPGSFPKPAWFKEVRQGFEFAAAARRNLSGAPTFEEALEYFERRAAPSLNYVTPEVASRLASCTFEPFGVSQSGYSPTPGVSHLRYVQLSPPHERVVVVSDMRASLVLLYDLNRPEAGLQTIARVPHPAAAAPIDLDQDGLLDLIVGDLGSLLPGNHRNGEVIWLRRDPESDRYLRTIIAGDMGRVADVQPADFDGDGDLDLVVAAFGWRTIGSVLLLENRTQDWEKPQFVRRTLEEKTGAIHVPVADLNGDGRPDFVALFSQEHETIIAFVNQGAGTFRQEVVFAATDPAYGSTGIQLIDIDQDGDLDVLFSNGDSMDSMMIKPYHGIQWLENEGKLPFRYHHVATLPGVHRALAGDLDHDGDLDVVATSFLPNSGFSQRRDSQLHSLIWLENEGGRFLRHVLESEHCDHAVLDLADCDGDGRQDIIVGNFSADGLKRPRQLPPMKNIFTIWHNREATLAAGP